MLWDRVEGSGRQVRGFVREWWGQLVDDKRAIVRGRGNRILGRLQARHGIREGEVKELVESTRRRRV